MMNKNHKLPKDGQLAIENKSHGHIRFVSFNVNGVKTLFNYHPWNTFSQQFDPAFDFLKADIISLQELKLSSTTLKDLKLVSLKNYKSFISLPRIKKGYSGVGLFVRIPDDKEDVTVKSSLRIVKAEEGVSGFLKSPEDPERCYRDLPESDSIGGYPRIDNTLGVELDKEGRCICIELASNLVVFSVYCPANSSQTQTGETYRMNFLRALFERCYNLKYVHKKEVVVLGDINVCVDLIDHADELNARVKNNLVTNPILLGSPNSGNLFERANVEECNKFKSSTPARKLLNSYVVQSENFKDLSTGRNFLFDSTRIKQERRMNMFTVWNTLTNARQSNYGSRIDLILASSEEMCNNISRANILPNIMGSDHCPVFTDFDSTSIAPNRDIQHSLVPEKLKFEAKYYYNLDRYHDISQMFKVGTTKRSKHKLEKSPDELPNGQSPSENMNTSRKRVKAKTISDYFSKN
ncbi:Piso0_001598 [Millerozyma farinosa CBS 7064]|uniref:Piso0_001598 protein n=1 Tax=Pichia sorbitophila (strain ATCC MYA-4447 / BCRC 22081 / CBS 7064 / NBRC 10061 / NRRL Y-12695) TaxID=559304 RepID=G8YL79_PICSO|nr:Piso0_001598 [Millerozyma farinosa CBS 7064]